MKNNPITVSICIPTYNQTFYLRKVLDSIFEQSFLDFEIIISDDSTNNSVKNLIDEYKQYDNIFYYAHSKPLGSPENWNFALKKANGKFIKVMHHDDWFIEVNSLEKLVNSAKNNNKSLVFSAGQSIRNNIISIHKPNRKLIEKFNHMPMDLLKGNFIGGPSSVLFHNTNKLFDNKLKWLVDIDYYVELIRDGYKIVYLEELLYASVIDDHNITNDCINNFELNLYEHTRLYLKYTHSFYDKMKYFFIIYSNLNKIKKTSVLQLYNYIKYCKKNDK